MGIAVSDELQISGVTEMTDHGVPSIHLVKTRYQSARLDEENLFALPISHGYQPPASISESKITGSANTPGVRQNDTSIFGPNCGQLTIGISSTTPKEQACKVSDQSNKGIDHHNQIKTRETHQLAGDDVPAIQNGQCQCQIVCYAEEIDNVQSDCHKNKSIDARMQKTTVRTEVKELGVGLKDGLFYRFGYGFNKEG
ncbi:hypothetical protein A4A49_32239 [Nicotiana attenuata]|uniref:Uncharacterized protein n=1 Tax=Nicotiana attenuata TaxID=49451 RepID=A0A1J6K105_NICAT|nr:hypothetical protein A4A49_32239 [Nicotiana attenuata]